jgi:acyl dehydratase
VTAPDESLLWTATETLTLRDLVRYAGASGDLNPIHYDRDFAVSRGLPNVIVHGTFTIGIVARLLRANFADLNQIDRLGARFVGVLVPDREITFSCYETGERAGAHRTLRLDVRHTGAEHPSATCAVEITETAATVGSPDVGS